MDTILHFLLLIYVTSAVICHHYTTKIDNNIRYAQRGSVYILLYITYIQDRIEVEVTTIDAQLAADGTGCIV